MGKGILTIVLGFTLILTYIIFDLNENANAELEETIDFYEQTQARLIANSAVEIYLEKMRRDKSIYGSFKGNELLDGTYNIQISGPDSALTITVNSQFGSVSHTTIVTASRKPIIIPDVNSSIYVSSTNIGLNLNGNIDIDGNDHNMDGSPGSSAPLPGIAVDSPADSAFIIDNLKSKIYNSIKGEGGAPSVKTITDLNDWYSLTQDYIYAADITLPSGTYTTGTILGTYDEPKITFVNGDVDFSGTAYGYGVLVVNGDISMSGQFTFNGIIIAYGDSEIETKTVGNAGIYGAAIFVGQQVDIQATGNAKFYYSKPAIDKAQELTSTRFDILSWWE